MTKIYLIRHGETTWNAETRAQGSKNISLSERGRQQATALSKRMKKYEIDYIYSSDLDRAYETAQIVAQPHHLQVHKIEGFREMCFGEWEGLTNDEIKSRYDEHYTVWRNKPQNAIIPGGEKLINVQTRGLEALFQLKTLHKDKNIVIVSHGITIKAILLGLLDMDLSYFYKISQENTCINLIEFRKYGPVITKLNDTCHIETMD